MNKPDPFGDPTEMPPDCDHDDVQNLICQACGEEMEPPEAGREFDPDAGGESAAYRSAMRDAGRGRLLR